MGFGTTMGVTAIGDTVNISSRLEAAAKEYDADIVISEAAAKLSGIDFAAARISATSTFAAGRGRSASMSCAAAFAVPALRAGVLSNLGLRKRQAARTGSSVTL